MARLSQLEVLDAGNIDVALPHLDVLSLAVEPGATNGAEAMRLVGQIERAELGESLLGPSSPWPSRSIIAKLRNY